MLNYEKIMQTNYAAEKRPIYKDHVKYSSDDTILDPSRTEELALAQNFLLYAGIDDTLLELKEWNEKKYLSDLLVTFKNFVPPSET